MQNIYLLLVDALIFNSLPGKLFAEVFFPTDSIFIEVSKQLKDIGEK